MKFVLLYESNERELQNAYLLKNELERRGHRLYICDPFRMLNVSREKFDIEFDAVLTPYLYEEDQLEKIFKPLFKHKIKRIINLQYEQILSMDKEKLKSRIPSGMNKNAIHLCWGKKWQNIMIENGVPIENCPLVGSMNVDMCRERFKSLYQTKDEISIRYNLNKNKKWILFISSFGLVNLSKRRKKYYDLKLGKELVDDRIYVEEKSRYIILDWIRKYINDNECEFIYRPHPSEALDQYIMNIENDYKNFHIINKDAIRSWIKVCDKIHTWYSTSIVDIYFMGKTCSILRPLDIPRVMHNGLLNSGIFTKTYEDFCKFNDEDVKEFPLDENLILDEFYIDKNKYTYEIICDLLEDIVNKNVIMNLY